MHRFILLLFSLFYFSSISTAQLADSIYFASRQRMLKLLYVQLQETDGPEKQQAELLFRDSLFQVVSSPGSEQFNFDSLPFIGRIASIDKKLIIYSWNIPQPEGYHHYFCIAQYYLKEEKKYKSTLFIEEPGFINKSPQGQATSLFWPGALYYEIVSTRYKGKEYFTLLGYDFNHLLSNRKLIEVLGFSVEGLPFFEPKAIFYDGKPHNRMIFEYNERAQMMLRYSKADRMIVFDHLSPAKPSLEGQFQFYGPDLSFDGLVFEEGIWKHKTDIIPTF